MPLVRIPNWMECLKGFVAMLAGVGSVDISDAAALRMYAGLADLLHVNASQALIYE